MSSGSSIIGQNEVRPENHGTRHRPTNHGKLGLYPGLYYKASLFKPSMPSDRITKIRIRYGYCINSLSFSYTFNGETYTEDWWGRDVYGGDKYEVVIEDDDELIGIFGSYGKNGRLPIILSLYFKTKKHDRLGPDMEDSQDTFYFSFDEDRILSFSVWICGSGLDDEGICFSDISVQTICDQDMGEPYDESHQEKQKMEGVAALDSLKFALRKIQDMQSSEAARLSGAIDLSRVSSGVQSIQNTLRNIHGVLMNANVNWDEADSNVQNSITQLDDLSKCTERVISMFLIEVATIIPLPLPGTTESINTKPVNIYALYKLSQEIKEIKPKADNINMECLEEHCNRAISATVVQPHPSIDEIDLLGLKDHQKKIISMLLDRSPEMHHVVVAARATARVTGSAKTVLAEKIYQRFFIFLKS